MYRDANWPALIAIFGLLACVGLVLAIAARERSSAPPADLRYFHAHVNATHGGANLGDVSMQVKGVAAARHVPPQEVRRLMEQYANGTETPGRRSVNIDDINQALDERWPAK